MKMKALLAVAFAAALTACFGGGSSAGGGASGDTPSGNPDTEPPSTEKPQAAIVVLSNRPDLISGGDALVELLLSSPESSQKAGGDQSALAQLDTNDIAATLNGVDVSSQFALRENGRVMALLSGLRLGSNTLRLSGAVADTEATISNHPNFGPVFSAGQHRRDGWVECAAGEQSSLGDCNVEVSYSYWYKSTSPFDTDLKPFNPDQGVPGDVATTTTDNGETLPFIVRREDGYQDRDKYAILTLFKLGEDWQPWAPQSQWTGKVLATHGANCNMSFTPGEPQLHDQTGGVFPAAPEHTYIRALGKGFAVMSTALNNNGHNCDHVLQAESMMMAKERLIEQYGELRYTIGTGCSGGAIAQQLVANAYPGIYQGLITTCAYPDSMSPAVQAYDYHLMRKYFEDPSRWAPGVVWTPLQFGLVEGHISHVNAVAMDELLFKQAVMPGDDSPAGACAGEDTYNPQTNPEGVRCGAIEWYRHIWGTQAFTIPGGDTVIDVSNVPVSNEGIMYGLANLQQGLISPAQFVDLNVKIGGLNPDIQRTDERARTTEPVVASAYRSGAANVANNMDSVAIINLVGPDPGLAHDSVHAWWTRWRLDREHGHHDNHVMWGGPFPLLGDPYFYVEALDALDRWLAAVEQDGSQTSLAEKIAANRPSDVHDQCSSGAGQKLGDEICLDLLRTPFAYGTPRTVAGADEYASNYACQLKPFSRDDDFGLLPFAESEWQQLEALFSTGVCDYEQRGLGEYVKTVPWMNYQDGEGNVLIGGEAMPGADYPRGWGSESFHGAWPQ